MYGIVTLYDSAFQPNYPQSTTGSVPLDYNSDGKACQNDFQVELLPLHSQLLGESLLVSFPPLINMLKSSGSSYLISGPILRLDWGVRRQVQRTSLSAHKTPRRDGPGCRQNIRHDRHRTTHTLPLDALTLGGFVQFCALRRSTTHHTRHASGKGVRETVRRPSRPPLLSLRLGPLPRPRAHITLQTTRRLNARGAHAPNRG